MTLAQAALGAALLAMSGCASADAAQMIELTEADLPLSSLGEGGWESAPFDSGPWIHYPPRATLVLHHSLGRAPRQVLVYLAFDDNPLQGGGGTGLAAGDLARVLSSNQDTVTVRNDTEGDYHVRVVLE